MADRNKFDRKPVPAPLADAYRPSRADIKSQREYRAKEDYMIIRQADEIKADRMRMDAVRGHAMQLYDHAAKYITAKPTSRDTGRKGR